VKLLRGPGKGVDVTSFQDALRDLVREYCGKVNYAEAIGVLEIMQHEIVMWMNEEDE